MMKTWVPRYEQIAHLSPDEKLRFFIHGKRTVDRIAGIGILTWLGVTLIIFHLCRHVFPEAIQMALISPALIIVIYLITTNYVALLNGGSKIQKEQWHNAQAFSALIEFANILTGRSEDGFRSWAMDNLTVVLPLVQDEQYLALSAKQKRKLYALITVDAYPDFLMAAIETVGCFADVEALPTVRKVAAAATFTPQQREVRQRAQECATFLEARVQEKTLEQSLLRGSQANTDNSRILLRAVSEQETSEAERQELLRANVQQ